MNAPVTGHRPASQPLAGLLLGLLTALLLLTLALPLLNPVSWLGRAAPLILGPADQPIATLNRYSLLYKSDNRGFYLVVRSQWQLLKPLQEGDKVRVELLNDKGVRIDQLSQAVDKRQKCRKERCTLSLNSALRAPDDALDSRYQLRIGLLLADRPESAEYSQILQTLPERGFNLLYLMTSLLLVLLVSAAVLKALLPRLRRSYRARVAGSLLLGNLTFVLLHGFVVFKLGEFLFWSGFRPEHYYLAWGSMVLGWSLCALAGFSLYMGLLFTALSGIGLLANFMKIAIYGVPLGGTIWATCWPCCTSCSISTLWCRCSSCWGSSFWCGASPSPAGSCGACCAPPPPPPPSSPSACSPPKPATSCSGPTSATWTGR